MSCKCVIVAGETVVRCAAHAPREIGINLHIDPDYTKKLQRFIDAAKGFRSGGVIGHPVMKDKCAPITGRILRYKLDIPEGNEPDKHGDVFKADPLSSGDFDFKIDASKKPATLRALNYLAQAQEAERSMAIWANYWKAYGRIAE